jgi:hypothetical protein
LLACAICCSLFSIGLKFNNYSLDMGFAIHRFGLERGGMMLYDKAGSKLKDGEEVRMPVTLVFTFVEGDRAVGIDTGFAFTGVILPPDGQRIDLDDIDSKEALANLFFELEIGVYEDAADEGLLPGVQPAPKVSDGE